MEPVEVPLSTTPPAESMRTAAPGRLADQRAESRPKNKGSHGHKGFGGAAHDQTRHRAPLETTLASVEPRTAMAELEKVASKGGRVDTVTLSTAPVAGSTASRKKDDTSVVFVPWWNQTRIGRARCALCQRQRQRRCRYQNHREGRSRRGGAGVVALYQQDILVAVGHRAVDLSRGVLGVDGHDVGFVGVGGPVLGEEQGLM